MWKEKEFIDTSNNNFSFLKMYMQGDSYSDIKLRNSEKLNYSSVILELVDT